MRLNQVLTFRGAVRLLGQTEEPLLEELDGLLGGLISGTTPINDFAVVWAVVRPKSGTTPLLRGLVNRAAKRIAAAGGVERYELIAAVHTVVVVASLFEAYQKVVGKALGQNLRLSEKEKQILATEGSAGATGLLPSSLVAREYSLPLAHEGLLGRSTLSDCHAVLFTLVDSFVRTLDAWQSPANKSNRPKDFRPGTDAAAARAYQDWFLDLADEVPEFFVWSASAGQGDERPGAQTTHAELAAALRAERESLGRLEEVLTQLSIAFRSTPERNRTIVAGANRAVLTETIVPSGAVDQFPDVVFPTVERIYQSPVFRVAMAGGGVPGDENWWKSVPERECLDLFFAAFLASPESVSTPLLLLGHPGAGKSMLTKVLAARLPASAYTAVRVPLRRVDAEAPVYEQIQQALDLATNRRVKWADLADEGDTTRVVFLDGLDELLQASTHSRTSYLQEVAEFQRQELYQRRPVAFVVTSRTVVADRVRIAGGTPVVKLEEFTDAQIGGWLKIWRDHNHENIKQRRVGEVALNVALKHRALACQPLLLMMLAIYAADPKAPKLGTQLSNAVFYGRILDSFVRREVEKEDQSRSPADEISELVEDQLWRLGIAGFAMFNRDRQDITDHELGLDILALTGGPEMRVAHARPAQVGQETIGKFFFVYTAEADGHREQDVQRAYEFLHATFGEYLVAHYSVKVLIEVADNSRQARRGGREYDDDLLFALLCHQSLATRRSTVNFVSELFARLPDRSKQSCARALETLFQHYRNRASTTSYDTYQPLPADHVRKLAAYSSNIVLLLAVLAPLEGVELEALAPSGQTDRRWWASTVELWRSGLEQSGWESLCHALDVNESGRVVLRSRLLLSDGLEIGFQQLRLNERDLARYQWGLAVEGLPSAFGSGSVYSDLLAELILVSYEDGSVSAEAREMFVAAVSGLRDDDGEYRTNQRLAAHLCDFLAKRGGELGYKEVRALANLAVRHAKPDQDLSGLAPVVAAHPGLLVTIPELASPARYGLDAVLPLYAAETAFHQDAVQALQKLRSEIEERYGIRNWFSSRDGFLIVVRKMFRISDAVDRRRRRSREPKKEADH